MLNDDQHIENENEPHLVEPAFEPPVVDGEPAEPEAIVESGEPVAAGTPRLVVKRNGAETDTEFMVHSPTVIGRFDPAVGPIDVDLAGLPEGAYVSRKHAKITNDDGVWKIHDLGSSNGTFVLR